MNDNVKVNNTFRIVLRNTAQGKLYVKLIYLWTVQIPYVRFHYS